MITDSSRLLPKNTWTSKDEDFQKFFGKLIKTIEDNNRISGVKQFQRVSIFNDAFLIICMGKIIGYIPPNNQPVMDMDRHPLSDILVAMKSIDWSKMNMIHRCEFTAKFRNWVRFQWKHYTSN